MLAKQALPNLTLSQDLAALELKKRNKIEKKNIRLGPSYRSTEKI